MHCFMYFLLSTGELCVQIHKWTPTCCTGTAKCEHLRVVCKVGHCCCVQGRGGSEKETFGLLLGKFLFLSGIFAAVFSWHFCSVCKTKP